MTEELHIVDVKTRNDYSVFWEVHLSDGTVMHVLKARCPDELSAYAFAITRIGASK